MKTPDDHVGEAADARRDALELGRFISSPSLKFCGKRLLPPPAGPNSPESPLITIKVIEFGARRQQNRQHMTNAEVRDARSAQPGFRNPRETLPACDSDRCLCCGRRHLASLSSEELASSAQEWRRLEVAAASLRLVTDRRQALATPQRVRDLGVLT